MTEINRDRGRTLSTGDSGAITASLQVDAPTRSRFRVEPRAALLLLGIAAGIFGLWVLQFENLDFIVGTILVVFLLMGIPLQAHWAIYFFLAAALTLRFVFAPNNVVQLSWLDRNDLLFALAVMTFTGICFRFNTLGQYIRLFPQSDHSAKSNRKIGDRFPSLLGGRWWLIPVALLGAVVLLRLIPFDGEASRRYWITPTGARLIFLTFFLFFFWFVCRSLIAFAMRWRMEPEQADIQVRSIIASEFWDEQHPIESRRSKYRIRNRRI